MELFLNHEPIEVDSVRIYIGSVMYEGSYWIFNLTANWDRQGLQIRYRFFLKQKYN